MKDDSVGTSTVHQRRSTPVTTVARSDSDTLRPHGDKRGAPRDSARSPTAPGECAIAIDSPQAVVGRIHAVPLARDPCTAGGSLIAEAAYRIFEIVVAAIGLILGLPVMALLALCIRLETPGPAFFRQRRCTRWRVVTGRDAEKEKGIEPPPGGFEPDKLYFVPTFFRLVKFRTMFADSRTRFPDLYAYRYEPSAFHGLRFKDADDPRVTPLGCWLRRLSIDELPNLWCVLTGNMRLVGPRPEIPEVLQYYLPEEIHKFSVKPGLTGLAQINGRGELTWGETIAWDLEYVRTRSVALDLKIIAATAWFVLVRRGAF
jgi:lipopolysaccharide/colanic/teichoic acid biosynthesis glycosyltransferase